MFGLPIVGFLLIGLIIVFLFLDHINHHPSDQALSNNFRSHRETLEKLLEMADEDLHVQTIYDDQLMFDDYKIWPQDGRNLFSSQRWTEYGIVFSALQPIAKHELHKDGMVILIPASVETTDPDENLEYRVSVKGYAYSRGPLSGQASLDFLGVNDLGRSYRRIDEHWYLYHDCGIGKPE